MMKRLTKTERTLLESATLNHYGRVSVVSGYISSRRSRKAYGARERDAAYKLAQAGLLEFIESHKSTRHLCHGFGADLGSDKSYRITEAGREALATRKYCS
jgi:hypothetical protein